jgi:RNA polymerase sigma-B factor
MAVAKVRWAHQLTLVAVVGALDAGEVSTVDEALRVPPGGTVGDVLLDLTELRRLDIAVAQHLRSLVEVREPAGHAVLAAGAHAGVSEVLRIAGAAEALGITPPVREEGGRGRPNLFEDASVRRLLRVFAHLPPDARVRPELRDRLVGAVMPLAEGLARRYRESGEPTEDLTQVAAVALLKSIDRFQPERGDFFGYAVATIDGELKRHLRDRSWAVRPPREIQDLSRTVRRAETDLFQLVNGVPSTTDIARHLDLPEHVVAEASSAHHVRRPLSLQMPMYNSDVPLADLLATDDHRIDDIDCWVALRPLIAALPERTRRILELRFGRDLSQARIGELMGLSQMHVSRILASTLRQLRWALLDIDPEEGAPGRVPGGTL